jgi:hypothetical protein
MNKELGKNLDMDVVKEKAKTHFAQLFEASFI